MKFQGIKAPVLNTPLIELETLEGTLIDLYNDCQFESVALRGDELAFTFLTETEAALIVVGFEGVRHLRVVQSEDWAPQEAIQIDHLLIRPEGPWPGVVFKAGGLDYEFDCTTVVLTGS
jgi:hypothetical protein